VLASPPTDEGQGHRHCVGGITRPDAALGLTGAASACTEITLDDADGGRSRVRSGTEAKRSSELDGRSDRMHQEPTARNTPRASSACTRRDELMIRRSQVRLPRHFRRHTVSIVVRRHDSWRQCKPRMEYSFPANTALRGSSASAVQSTLHTDAYYRTVNSVLGRANLAAI
jgi:hypothetical protein